MLEMGIVRRCYGKVLFEWGVKVLRRNLVFRFFALTFLLSSVVINFAGLRLQ